MVLFPKTHFFHEPPNDSILAHTHPGPPPDVWQRKSPRLILALHQNLSPTVLKARLKQSCGAVCCLPQSLGELCQEDRCSLRSHAQLLHLVWCTLSQFSLKARGTLLARHYFLHCFYVLKSHKGYRCIIHASTSQLRRQICLFQSSCKSIHSSFQSQSEGSMQNFQISDKN